MAGFEVITEGQMVPACGGAHDRRTLKYVCASGQSGEPGGARAEHWVRPYWSKPSERISGLSPLGDDDVLGEMPADQRTVVEPSGVSVR
jgi:hypothetical protein